MTDVIHFISGYSLTAQDNTITYCNTGTYGLYYLSQIKVVTDMSSTYEYNSGLSGGVYYIDGG